MPLFILSACRTPFGALGGSLKAFTAPELAGAAMGHLLRGADPLAVEACCLGQAVQAGAGANPAREAARLGGLPPRVAALTLNQGHASGLRAVLLAAQGPAGLAVAGGMESASSAPYLLPSARWGTRMGTAPVLDALLLDAHWPPLRGRALQRCLPAPGEVIPLATGQDDLPEGPFDLLPADGAALLLLGAGPAPGALARILAWGEGGDEAEAAGRALAMAGLTFAHLDLLEVDGPGAFPQANPALVNLQGGAATLGLAPGAEGARKVVALAHHLKAGKLRYGLAALDDQGCALALILESL